MIGFSECRQGDSFVAVLERSVAVIQGVVSSRREVDMLFKFWQAPGKFGFVKISENDDSSCRMTMLLFIYHLLQLGYGSICVGLWGDIYRGGDDCCELTLVKV